MLSELLTSNSRAEILRILFDGKGQELYLREIERRTYIQVSSLQKEVKYLTSLDLVNARQEGNRVYYKANILHPIYEELVSIVAKTVGIISMLKDSLQDERIECAFVFGSIAKGTEHGGSDIDLVVIGKLRMKDVSEMLYEVEEKLGREINPHVYSTNEFKKQIKEKRHFVTSVMKEKNIYLVGDLSEFR